MFNNIFRKYDFDNLYIGVVTIYRNKNKKPSCVKVDVPPSVEKVSYVTILSKLSNDAYLQIDNEQCCFYFGNKYKDYSNFPVVTNLISLRNYYEHYHGKKEFLVYPWMNKRTREKIIDEVSKKAMVV